MNKASGYLGIACRARKTISGELLFQNIAKGGIYLIVLSDDIGENSKKKLIDKCRYYHVPYVFMSKDDMILVVKRKALGITDKGLATQLITCLKG